MDLRRGLLAVGAVVAAAGCSGAGDRQDAATEVAKAEEIDCALAGAADFSRECVVEQAPRDGALYLVVRHPDGAFRRFEVLKDGRGVSVADGADEARTELSGERLDVTVGKDRYRFPVSFSPGQRAYDTAS